MAENTATIVRRPSAQTEFCWVERNASRKETKTNREAGGHANVNFSPLNATNLSALVQFMTHCSKTPNILKILFVE